MILLTKLLTKLQTNYYGNSTLKLTPPTMMAPSKMVAWECNACTFTDKDVQHRDCQLCMTKHPVRYAIVAGAAGAAMARTTTVNRCEQARLATLAALDVPAAVTEQAPAIAEEAPAVAEEQPAAPYGRARATVLTRILNTMVDIVGTSAEDRGRSCSHHTCCGHQIEKGRTLFYPQTTPPWWCCLPLLRCGIFGYARSNAGNLFQSGWPRAHTLGLM